MRGIAQVPESFKAMVRAFFTIRPEEVESEPEPDTSEYGWPVAVLPEQDTQKEGGIQDKAIELHVSDPYLKYGKLEGLERAGAITTRPTMGMKRHEKIGGSKARASKPYVTS